MDEIPGNELSKPGLASEPTHAGYSLEESRKGLTSGLYFDDNLEKGLGIDMSSIFYYELNGALDSSSSGKSIDERRYGSSDKMLSQDSAADLFSATGLSNSSKDYCWDIDFSKEVPDPAYQFCEESGSGNSNLVSQSSGTGKEAVGVSESSSQIIECQNDQLGMLITCENYMNSFVWEMLMNKELGLGQKSSSSCGPQDTGEANNVASSVETSESHHCRNKGYFGSSHDLNPLGVSYTSMSLQFSDVSPLEEDTKADDPSLQGVLINKPADSSDLQDIGEGNIVASPVDTGESYHHRNEGYVGTSRDLNSLGVSCTSMPMQCSDGSLVDDDTKAYDLSFQGVLINKPADSSDLPDIGEGNNLPSPVDTVESYHHRNEEYVGTSHDFNPLGVSCTSFSMQCSDASPVDEDTEVYDSSFQGVLINKSADSCDIQYIVEGNYAASPVDTSESCHHRDEGYRGTSHDSQRLLGTSIFKHCTDASPMVEDMEEDDPSLQDILLNKSAECRKIGVCLRQKRVRKSYKRSTSDSPDFKSRRPRRRKEESTSFPKNKNFEVTSQNKRYRKRTKEVGLLADHVLARRSSKQGHDSDEEYDPSHSNFKVRRSKKGSDRRKNNKTWTLSEVIKLVDGISQFGVGKWTAIQRSFFGSSPYRTSLDLRDKWRNLLRTSIVRLQHVKEEECNPKNGSSPLPKSLLERIRELDSVHPYPRSDVKLTRSCSGELIQSK